MQPKTPGEVLRGDPMFAHRADGSPIVRDATCECGAAFTQAMLSERFMKLCEKAKAARAVTDQIPELYVPVFCPRCERKDVQRWGRIAESRSLPDPRPSFGERDHAAD